MGKEIECRLPWHEIHEQYDSWPLAENVPEYVRVRGDWEQLHEMTGGGEGIKVGIGDTGVDRGHRRSGGDLSNVVEIFDVGYGTNDTHGHGTFTTSQICARSQGSGMVGMAPNVTAYHAKVLSDGGSGSSLRIARGVDNLVEAGCSIVSLSLGGGYSDDIEKSCREARVAGVIVIASMGNSGERGDGHPGNSENTVGSVAIDYNFNLARFSSRSTMATAANFGVQVYGAMPNGRYSRMSGTSMSAPNEAGGIALIQSAELKKFGQIRTRTLDDYMSLVRNASLMRDLGPDGHDRGYGYGFLELRRAIEFVLQDDTPPPPPPAGDPYDNAVVHFENDQGLYGPYRLTKVSR